MDMELRRSGCRFEGVEGDDIQEELPLALNRTPRGKRMLVTKIITLD